MNANQAPGQAEDLYDQDPRENSGEPKPKSDEGEGPTALIPKSLVPGDVQPGQEIVLVVKAVHEAELEIALKSSSKKEDTPPAEPLVDDNYD